MNKKKLLEIDDRFEDICTDEREINLKTLERVLTLSLEIAREGREGRTIGSMFVISDEEKVLERSSCLILDPLKGHSSEIKRIENPDMWESIKELAQLDGAFVVSDNSVVLSACRYIDASSHGIELPAGLGSRHIAAASITRETKAVAVVVSESSIVRVLDNGEIVAEIIPELWLLRRHGIHPKKQGATRSEEE